MNKTNKSKLEDIYILQFMNVHTLSNPITRGCLFSLTFIRWFHCIAYDAYKPYEIHRHHLVNIDESK